MAILHVSAVGPIFSVEMLGRCDAEPGEEDAIMGDWPRRAASAAHVLTTLRASGLRISDLWVVEDA